MLRLAATPTVLKLSDLSRLYATHLDRHMPNASSTSKINATHLKERLIENIPNFTAVTHGREVLLTFSEHLGEALHHMKDNADAEAVNLMHTAKIIRNEIFSWKQNFSGSLSHVKDDVPHALVTFVGMLLEGPGNCDRNTSQAALSISQLLMFNAVKRLRKALLCDEQQGPSVVRHKSSREMPLPVYVGMKLHSATRKKHLVEKFHKLGLSVSYERVMQIENKTANTVCKKYMTDDLVCPPVLEPNLFTVAALDNIDHNLTSTTAKSSFHGTAISVTQFAQTVESTTKQTPQSCCHYIQNVSDAATDIVLPSSYCEVPPCILPSTAPVIPLLPFSLQQSEHNRTNESDWLNMVHKYLSENRDDDDDDDNDDNDDDDGDAHLLMWCS